MPELPDIVVYVESLRRRVQGQTLRGIRIGSPFVLRSVEPRVGDFAGQRVSDVSRLGKQIVIETDGPLFAVIHLMIAGRLHWEKPGKALPGRRGLAAFDFDNGTLLLTEAGTKRRASLRTARGRAALAGLDRGGIDVESSALDEFRSRILSENHTVKRSLTDPRLFSGIGNAYSDEILHRARISPFQWTSRLTDDEIARLHASAIQTLREWTSRLRKEAGDGFPEGVTAFRPEMSVHGRFGKACPACQTPVQRIVYAENECNYCTVCQTGGRLLADRAISRLLRDDWPRSLDEWEAHLDERRETAGGKFPGSETTSAKDLKKLSR